MKKISNKFHQGALIFFAFFVGLALKLEKVGPTWINFKIVQTISRSDMYVNIHITIATEFWHLF